ncbi:MAG: ATPase, T2SS/T4P/T4SS family [Phycisphaerales bacterium]
MAHLEVHTRSGIKKCELAAGQFTIGRHASNSVAVTDDNLMSRHHCQIELANTGYVLRDLDSRNGTKIDGLDIVSVVLKPGTQFIAGGTAVVFVDDSPAAQPAAPISDSGNAYGMAFAGMDSEAIELDVEPGRPAVTDDDEDTRGVGGGNYGIGSFTALLTVGKDVPYGLSDVALINARGKTVHAASGGAARSKDATAEAIDIIRLLLLGCIRSGASDIHMEPKREGGLVRLRIDGAMVEVSRVDVETYRRLGSLVKILGDIDIAKKGIIQEGHFSVQVPDRRIDYRISFTPSMFGQKLVVRVLDPYNAPQQLNDLWLPDWMYTRIRDLTKQNTGMLLNCGPTGSGKTTTLYAALRQVDSYQRNVITIEDPVEYELPGVTQIPVDEEHGQSFHQLLRSCLRQDPEIIVLGEIRDSDTATAAMQAASTGHLVLSTVHAKDTIGTIFRLLDLGVEPYLIASTLNLVLAQRLARILCDHCKVPKRPSPEQVMRMGRSTTGIETLYHPGGCAKCFGTGYAGRRGVYELLTTNDALRDVIMNRPDMAAIRKAVDLTMFTSLKDAGYEMVIRGETSLEEVERVIGMD